MECGRAAAEIEILGIPTVTITREGFSQVVSKAFAGLGLPAEAPQVEFPTQLFLPESDLGALKENLDKIIGKLTAWSPQAAERGIFSPAKIRVTGSNYAEACDRFNALFLSSMWGDGLPLIPPTKDRVDWILQGTDLDPDQELGKVLPRGGIATVRALAVTLAMAGGRPEYLPFLLAAGQAFLEPSQYHERLNTTTCSAFPVVVVNGPAATQIRLGSGYGCLGPDPVHPAGASLGRALRLMLMDLGGTVPGLSTMSIYGGPARYTGLFFAEDEAGLPVDWQSIGMEQGFARGEDAVTVYSVSSVGNVPGGETGGSKTAALASLNRAAGFMAVPNGNYWFVPYNPKGAAGVLLMGRGTARGLSGLGWSKQKIKEYLWEQSKIPAQRLGPRFDSWWMVPPNIAQDPMPICVSPAGIKIVVAGGEQSGHMCWMQVGCCPEQMTSAKVVLPADWGRLLTQADQDLGPMCTPQGCFWAPR